MTPSTTKRIREIAVGDLIQYRFSYGPKGFVQWTQTTRRVIEVVDGGAIFVVEGFFNIYAKCVITHIPMHTNTEPGAVATGSNGAANTLEF